MTFRFWHIAQEVDALKKYATSFKLTKETIRQMDQLVEHPPPMLVDGINGKARNRTEVIEILVRYAHALIKKPDDIEAAKEPLKSDSPKDSAHQDTLS